MPRVSAEGHEVLGDGDRLRPGARRSASPQCGRGQLGRASTSGLFGFGDSRLPGAQHEAALGDEPNEAREAKAQQEHEGAHGPRLAGAVIPVGGRLDHGPTSRYGSRSPPRVALSVTDPGTPANARLEKRTTHVTFTETVPPATKLDVFVTVDTRAHKP